MPNKCRKVFDCLRIFFAEAIATGMLCFPFMLLDPASNEGILRVAFAVGFGIFCGVFVSGPVSGGHINPAVTIMCVFTRRLHPLLAPVYIIAQILGSILSCLVARACSPFLDTPDAPLKTLGMTLPAKGTTVSQAIGLEIVLTFGLVLGILTIIDELRVKTPFGIGSGAISVAAYVGFFHVFDVVIAGPVCGGSMNPARSLGPAIVNLNFDYQYIYVVGPICGAIFAGILYEFVLSAGACRGRSRAFFTNEFDRQLDYQSPNSEENKRGEQRISTALP